jgi:hypothetical protein
MVGEVKYLPKLKPVTVVIASPEVAVFAASRNDTVGASKLKTEREVPDMVLTRVPVTG